MHPYSFIKWSLCFFAYCLIGWIWETLYVYIRTGHWENRGFLTGPFLPIYGFGAIVILLITIPAKENILFIFLLGMLGASTLEYIGGTLMEAVFHTRFWDYSDALFNLNGHICFLCSMVWGIFSILLVKWIHPWVEQFVLQIPQNISIFLVLFLVFLMTLDFGISAYRILDI